MMQQTELHILPVGGSLCSTACLAPCLTANTFMSFQAFFFKLHFLCRQSKVKNVKTLQANEYENDKKQLQINRNEHKDTGLA